MQAEVAALTTAYMTVIDRTITGTGKLVAGLWLAAGEPSQAAAEVAAAQTLELTRGAQSRIATFADAYTQQSLIRLGYEVSPAGVDVDKLLSRPDERWLHSPALRWRAKLAQGFAPEQAAEVASGYARQLAEVQVRNAERKAADTSFVKHGGDANGVRFLRVPQSGACGFCRVTASKSFSRRAWLNDSGGWHGNCRCGWTMANDPRAVDVHVEQVKATWSGKSSDAIHERAEVTDE